MIFIEYQSVSQLMFVLLIKNIYYYSINIIINKELWLIIKACLFLLNIHTLLWKYIFVAYLHWLYYIFFILLKYCVNYIIDGCFHIVWLLIRIILLMLQNKTKRTLNIYHNKYSVFIWWKITWIEIDANNMKWMDIFLVF